MCAESGNLSPKPSQFLVHRTNIRPELIDLVGVANRFQSLGSDLGCRQTVGAGVAMRRGMFGRLESEASFMRADNRWREMGCAWLRGWQTQGRRAMTRSRSCSSERWLRLRLWQGLAHTGRVCAMKLRAWILLRQHVRGQRFWTITNAGAGGGWEKG